MELKKTLALFGRRILTTTKKGKILNALNEKKNRDRFLTYSNVCDLFFSLLP
jgi:hypothetical protein